MNSLLTIGPGGDPGVYTLSWVDDNGAPCSVTGLTLDLATNMLSGTGLTVVIGGESDEIRWDVSVDLAVRAYFHPIINDFPDNGTGVVTAMANAGPPQPDGSGARKKLSAKR